MNEQKGAPGVTSNPLTEADPHEIEELFSRDPLSLTEEEISEITAQMVRMLRAEREAWEREKEKAKLTGKKMSGTRTKKLQKKAALEAIKKRGAKIDLGAIMSGGGKK